MSGKVIRFPGFETDRRDPENLDMEIACIVARHRGVEPPPWDPLKVSHVLAKSYEVAIWHAGPGVTMQEAREKFLSQGYTGNDQVFIWWTCRYRPFGRFASIEEKTGSADVEFGYVRNDGEYDDGSWSFVGFREISR